jgi:hypothetical protein
MDGRRRFSSTIFKEASHRVTIRVITLYVAAMEKLKNLSAESRESTSQNLFFRIGNFYDRIIANSRNRVLAGLKELSDSDHIHICASNICCSHLCTHIAAFQVAFCRLFGHIIKLFNITHLDVYLYVPILGLLTSVINIDLLGRSIVNAQVSLASGYYLIGPSISTILILNVTLATVSHLILLHHYFLRQAHKTTRSRTFQKRSGKMQPVLFGQNAFSRRGISGHTLYGHSSSNIYVCSRVETVPVGADGVTSPKTWGDDVYVDNANESDQTTHAGEEGGNTGGNTATYLVGSRLALEQTSDGWWEHTKRTGVHSDD